MFLLKSDDHVMLVAGKHTYPFQFTLPKDLPSSLQANEYNVTYKIEASVDRPWKFDYTGESVFNVFSPIDLNCFENIHVRKQIEFSILDNIKFQLNWIKFNRIKEDV